VKQWRNLKDFILSFFYTKGKFFIVSFPNSGRSWLNLMIKNILKEIGKDDLLIENSHDFSEIIIEDGTRQDPNIIFKFTDRYKFFRSNVIFLSRDPRDIISSNYYQITNRAKNPFIFKNKTEFIRHDIFGFKRVVHFYNIWSQNKLIPRRFMLTKYENLLEGFEELRKVVKFLKLNVSDELIKKIYFECSADLMRKKELNNDLSGISNFGKSVNKLKVRKAIKGSYLNELDKKDINFCNIEMKKLSRYFNYKI